MAASAWMSPVLSPALNQVSPSPSNNLTKAAEKMAKSTIILIASTLCFLSMLNSAYGQDNKYFVEGSVYCDTCRAQFITRLTQWMAGATVRVECKDETGTLKLSKEAVTDAAGKYKVEVDGDHEEDMCGVVLVKSSNNDCAEIDHESHLNQEAMISITNNNGIVSPIRNASPLGFIRKERLPECAEVFKELGLQEDGTSSDDDN